MKVLLWLAALEAIGLVGRPLARRLFPFHADRGVPLGRVLVLLAFGLVVFLAGSAGWISRTRGELFFVAVLVCAGALSAGLVGRRDGAGQPCRREMLLSEAIFAGCFFAFLLPLLFTDTGRFGERAMDLAFLNELTFPGPLPPENPYLAGRPLNYYYFGHLVFASQAALLGIRAGDAYLLATASVAALTVSAAWSLASRLVPRLPARGLVLWLTCLSTNLAYAREWPGGSKVNLFLGSNWMVGNAIDEYPLYTFLIAELHAHALALPAYVAFLALLIGLFSEASGARNASVAVATALCLAVLGATSTWSMGTGAAVLVLLMTAVPFCRRFALGAATAARASLRGAFLALALVAGSACVFLPFYRKLEGAGFGVGFVGALTSDPLGFAGHWGLWLWVGIGLAAFTLRDGRAGAADMVRDARIAAGLAAVAVIAVILHAAAVATVTRSLPLALALGTTGVALLTGWRERGDADALVSWLLVAAGGGFIAACEVVYLDDFHTGALERATTVFKLYLDAWLLLGIGTAYPLGRFVAGLGQGKFSAGRVVWFGMLVLALVLGAAYAAAGAWAKSGAFRSGPHLSATHFLGREQPAYAAALRWLGRRPRAVPPAVLVENVDARDRDAGWLSAASPFHAYLAWPQQLVQWGYSPAEIRARWRVVDRVYNDPDTESACSLMRAEGIDVVHFGAREEKRYGAAAREKFLKPPFRELFATRGGALYACG